MTSPETAAPGRARRWGTPTVIAAVALAYGISGWLGLLLTIPPGYATAVFPASGIALAAILLAGPRAALGVWLGSFCLNVATTFEDAALTASFGFPALIATGATAQALLGAFLIRRFVGYTNLLVQELDVVKILLLGGPIACLLNPAVSITALWLTGRLANDIVLLNYWTWWVGDSIGVLVFAPLVLVWAVRPYRVWGQRQLFVTLPLAGLFATVTAMFVFVSEREQARIDTEFDALTTELGRALQKDLGNALAALGSLEGFYASSADVEKYEFDIFAGRLLHVIPAVRTLVWAEVVPGSRRADFERALRADGHPQPRITVRAADGTFAPAPEAAVHVVPRYVVPSARNEIVLGFDLLSEPSRRAALEEARDTGRVAATGRVDLMADGGPGLLAFMPVYRHGVLPSSIAARRRYVDGFAIATFRIGSLMEGIAAVAAQKGYVVRLYDDARSGRSELIYEWAEAAAGPGALQREFRFNFAGRPLRLWLQYPAQALLAQRSWETWFVLAGGLLLSSLVGMLLLLGVGRNARVEALVDARTTELRRLNAHLTEEAARRRRLEQEAEKRATELSDSNAELQRRAEVNRQLLRSLRHSEAELRRTATQLASSNRELEQFAYVASHDLKAPLRSIGSFAQLLERRYAAQFPGEAAEFLGFIQEGIRQMQALIDDLLQLSRVDARRLEPAPIEMQSVVDRACRQLTADLKATQAQVDVGPLPEVHADGNMLVQLLQNLIANGIKFQRAGNRPHLRIDGRADGDYWHFTVQDNGIGIEARHLSLIFMVFKRLHTLDQFPGNGIGLAICKKVVNLHGGEIWADSTPGAGTTIHFTLPRRLEPAANDRSVAA